MSTSGLFDANEHADSCNVERTPNLDVSRSSGTTSLYRKFRPQTFDASDLVGQDAIVQTLKNAVRTNRVAHAYLFTGPRGTGKTTTARLLAKAVNCLDQDLENRPCNKCDACNAIAQGSAIDVLEIDAASNRGIDDIRELRERVRFAPVQLRTKFYIIDEAHQITGAAANAFLKTLEEPPDHTRFVLATTDPEQILPTIVSRCQRFEFRRIPTGDVVRRLEHVADLEGLSLDAAALAIIANHSQGSLRDALGLLDQLASFNRSDAAGDEQTITGDDVRSLLGLSRDEVIVQLVDAIADQDAAIALDYLQSAIGRGSDPRQIARQIVQVLREVMHAIADPLSERDPEVRRLANRFGLAEAMDEAERFSELDFKVRHGAIPQLPLEIGLVRATLRGNDAVRNPSPAPPLSTFPIRPETEMPASNPPNQTPPNQQRSLSEKVRGNVIPISRGSAASGETSKPRSSDAHAGPVPTIETVRTMWDQVRANVKARSRRIDALLMSVDPHSMRGDTLVLVSAYPFHKSKLGETDVRRLLEDVLADTLGASLKIETVLAHEPVQADGSTGEPNAQVEARPGSPSDSESRTPPSDGGKKILDAAKNLFDAEEIGP